MNHPQIDSSRLVPILFLIALCAFATGISATVAFADEEVSLPDYGAVYTGPVDFPKVEAPLVVPGIRRGSERALIVYRHSGTGFFQSNGWDTLIVRFFGSSSGGLASATVARRDLYGETVVQEYTFVPSGEGMVCQSRGTKDSTESFRLLTSALRVELRSGESSLATFTLNQGKLGIESTDGGELLREEWEPSGSSLGTGKDGRLQKAGRYSAPAGDRRSFIERGLADPDGIDETLTSFSLASDRLRMVAGTVAPICDVYAVGLQSLLGGPRGLENMVLVEALLDARRSLRPVLAWMLLDEGGRH